MTKQYMTNLHGKKSYFLFFLKSYEMDV